MKRILLILLSVSIALGMTCFAVASEKAPKKEELPSVEKGSLIEMMATVVSIDKADRTVTLKGARGKTFTVKVDKRVKNFPQVKVGDEVKVTYYEAIAIQVVKPDEAKVGVQGAGVVAESKPGQKPGGMEGSVVSVTTVIEAIDQKNQTVTLKGPRGHIQTIKVREPENLKKVKVGDKVVITYTEALAVSVQKP